MLPQENASMLGIYSRPSHLESTLMDEIVYTNDFREACSWIIDQIAEMYVYIKPLMPYYIHRNANDKPSRLISDILNPYRNNADRSRTSSERFKYHARIASRYIDGQVPTEDGGKMIRAVTAFYSILRELHDCPELQRLEDNFGDYSMIWNHVRRCHMTPDQFAAHLHAGVEKIIDCQRCLYEAWRTWENSVWPCETQFAFSETDTIIQHERLSKLADNILAKQSKLGRDFAHRGSETLAIIGPRTEGRRKQVYEVVVYLANPKHSRSLHNACAEAFKKTGKLKDGYATIDQLYQWCLRNESQVNELVMTYRLEHFSDER